MAISELEATTSRDEKPKEQYDYIEKRSIASRKRLAKPQNSET